MDESVFVVIVLVISLCLTAGLYYVNDRHSQCVLGLASEARSREETDKINQHRLARTLNELIDEIHDLTESLKTERIQRSHNEATAGVATKKAQPAPAPALPPDNRPTVVTPPSAEALERTRAPAEDDATSIFNRDDRPTLDPPSGPG